MKIGISAGLIPPPVFIENLLNKLASQKYRIYIYGNLSDNRFKFKNINIVPRVRPTTKLGICMYSFFLHFQLLFRMPKLFFTLINKINLRSKNIKNYIIRSTKVIPPFLDNLNIFHVQWAKTIVEFPEFLELMPCHIILSLRGAHINYSPLVNQELSEGYKQYFPKISAFHAVSNAIAEEALKYNCSLDKITVIKPAVDKNLINFSSKNISINKKINIISVGRSHWKKGYTTALDTMSLLNKEKVDFQYTIIANGVDRENINYQINALGLNEKVMFINGLSHNKVIKQISQSDLFILSSYEEGISNAVLESMLLGIPVISTDCGGMKEVITNNINGFLVPVRDPLAIAKIVQKFLNLDQSELKKIKNNAIDTILNNHLLDSQIDSFKSLYESIS